MSGNTFGRLFCLTSFGESHGPAIGCVVDGCPPGLKLDEVDIQRELDRRRPGRNRNVTRRQEEDRVEILSGVFEGKTTGTPIGLLIRNQDQRSRDYQDIALSFRPGHADYTYNRKYGLRDYRGGGRASARETAVRVAGGAIARKWLTERYGITIRAWLSQLGEIKVPFSDAAQIDNNDFFAADATCVPQLEEYLSRVRKSRDSVGAAISVQASGVPSGWGEPVYDRLDADIAHAMMGINAVKGVEIGAGFAAVNQLGSEHGDEMRPAGFLSNNAGGILGGISSGQDIMLRLAFKPTSSIAQPRRSIDALGQPVDIATRGRHDPCVALRAPPIVEAMLALVLIDHALRHRAQCGDVEPSTPPVPAQTRRQAKVD